MELSIGDKIERYEITQKLGQGGMSVVYKATDMVLGRSVAIKMILPGQQQSSQYLKRFQREARVLAQLSHPNIVKVLDFGEHQNTPYLVMEYIPGGTLADCMGRPIPCAEAARYLEPVARALHYAHTHQHGIIHRDVKPGNILINHSGQPMLSDFGIVKLADTDESQSLTSTGALIGTPSYMAPEQVRGQPVDARTDVYALGVIFFEMVAGRKPYTGATPIEVTLKHLNEPIPRPRQFVRDLPPEAEAVIMKAMAKKPEDRFQDMAAFAAALEKLARLPRPVSRAGKISQDEAQQNRKKKKIIAVLLGLGAGAFFLMAAVAVAGFFLLRPYVPTPVSAANQTPSPTILAMAATHTVTQVHSPTPNPSPTARTPTETNTPFPTDTPAPTPTPLPADYIYPSNVDKLVELNKKQLKSVRKLAFTQDGASLIVAGSYMLSKYESRSLISSEKDTISLPGEIPLDIAMASKSQRLYLLLSDNRIRVIDVEKMAIVNTFDAQGGSLSLAISPDQALVAIGSFSKNIVLLDATDGTKAQEDLKGNANGWSVAFSPQQGNYIAAGTSQGAFLWELEAQSKKWIVRPVATGKNSRIKTLAFSKDAALLAGGGLGTIWIWDVSNRQEYWQIKGDFQQVNSLDFSPDGSLLAAACDDGIIYLWDIKARNSMARQLKAHDTRVNSVVFSPLSNLIVSGDDNGWIRVWGIP